MSTLYDLFLAGTLQVRRPEWLTDDYMVVESIGGSVGMYSIGHFEGVTVLCNLFDEGPGDVGWEVYAP